MIFSGGRAKRGEKIRKDLSSSHRLLMYKEPPLDNISLEDFEEFAIERLKGLLLFAIVCVVCSIFLLNSSISSLGLLISKTLKVVRSAEWIRLAINE